MSNHCYLLFDGSRSYIGATVNLDKRLKQHNGLLKGGAKYTAGRTWERVCSLNGFKTWSDTLKFEWRWKWFSRKQKGIPLIKRMKALPKTMEFFKNYDLEIVIEDNWVWEYVFNHIDEYNYIIIKK